jgi:alpha-beta hydrolase superfamily lysophospholipase
MTHIDEFYESINSDSVFRKNYLCDDNSARAAVILVHGICEHCDRYAYVIERLLAQRVEVYTFDQPGHGRSSGRKGQLSYDQTLKIIDHIKHEILADSPDLSVFVYGHSMGGAIAIQYGYKFPDSLKGCIITSPALGPKKAIPQKAIPILATLARIAPGITLRNVIEIELLSHDPTVNEAYEQDPMVHNKISLRLGADLVLYADRIMQEQAAFPVPAILLQGAQDGIVDPASTARFARFAGSEIEYHEIPEGFHELHNEPERDQYLDLILNWINNNIDE